MVQKQTKLLPGRHAGYLKLLLCGLLTLIAMYAHRYFPVKTLVVVPSSSNNAYLYMNDSPSRQSLAQWLDQDAMSWLCHVEQDGNTYTCGFHVTLGGGEGTEGIDLSGYNTLKLDIDYRGGDRRLRLYLRNYEPGFSDINRIETAKFNNVSIPIQFVEGPLTIQLKEFSVAEWWINNFQVPRHFSQPDYHHVIAFGIDLTYPAPLGDHYFQLNSLAFEGPWITAERWYFSILMFWIVMIITAGGIKLATLRRNILIERARLERLKNQNVHLAEETNRYKQLSGLDHLTGMLNRQGVAQYLEDNYGVDAERVISLAIMDIDHFKRINDLLGHDAGDKVLQKVAELIKSTVRQTDRAARWGGEEFIIIAPDSKIEDIYVVAEKLRSKLAALRFEEYPDLVVTASFGVGSHNQRGSFDDLFRRVDVALYQAKTQGRNRTVMAG